MSLAKYTRCVSGAIDPDLHFTFQEKCSKSGMTNSEGVREAISAWVEQAGSSSSLHTLSQYTSRRRFAIAELAEAAKLYLQHPEPGLLEQIVAVAAEHGLPLPEEVKVG